VIAFLVTPLGRRISGIALLMAIISALAGGIYLKGRADRDASILKDTVKAHETRDDIDEAVGRTGLYDRCIELGGMPDRCAELRGLEKPPRVNDPATLVQTEEALSAWVIGTDRFGRRQGCWN